MLRIAVAGAGIIGRTHIATLAKCEGMTLAHVIDPASGAADLAAQLGVPHAPTMEAALTQGGFDAVIVAAPNDLHLPLTRAALEAKLPVLLEKPVANDLADGQAMIALSDQTGVPVLVGHHRRHNPITKAAKAAISQGQLGDLVTATVLATLSKPGSYFDTPWRRDPRSGGPLAINLSHEIDLLRHFWGDIAEVQAMLSSAQRGFEVEDSAGVLLRFKAGGLATLTLTDAGAGPWAWDVSSGENPQRFPAHEAMAHAYSGTKAALSLPDLTLWQHPGQPDWTTQMVPRTLPASDEDPYIAQLTHFADVVHGRATPMVTLADGVANMAVIEAIRQAGATGAPVQL